MAQRLGHAAHDGEAQSEPGRSCRAARVEPRWNSSKIASCSAVGMPTPVSATSIRTAIAPGRRAPTRTPPRRGVADGVGERGSAGCAAAAAGRSGRATAVGRMRSSRCPLGDERPEIRARARRRCRRARTTRTSGRVTPASSLEMSSSVLRSSSIVCSAAIDLAGDALALLAGLHLGERRDRQAGGVERLQQVVARPRRGSGSCRRWPVPRRPWRGAGPRSTAPAGAAPGCSSSVRDADLAVRG